MCILDKNLRTKKEIGFKVVAEKNGRYYSITTGIRYHENKPIKIPKKQARIGNYFCMTLVNPDSGNYHPLMKGKTGAFKELHHAKFFFGQVEGFEFPTDRFNLVLMKVELSRNLMSGEFHCEPIIAGERIKFIEKVA